MSTGTRNRRADQIGCNRGYRGGRRHGRLIRDQSGDTRVFSSVLYRLSYLSRLSAEFSFICGDQCGTLKGGNTT